MAKSSKTKSKKVPKSNDEVTVLHLKCDNCGEEVKKVLYCEHCEDHLSLVKTEDRHEQDLEEMPEVKQENAGDDSDMSEDEVVNSEDLMPGGEDDIWESGLGDIFPSGDSDPSEPSQDIDLTDALSALDGE